MLIASNAERTSGSSPWAGDSSPLYASASRYAGASEIFRFFGSCRPVTGELIEKPGPLASGKRDAYRAQVMINSPSATTFISAGFGKINYTMYALGTHAPVLYLSSALRLTRTPEDLGGSVFEAWTETPASDFSAAMSASINELRNIVAAIRARARLQLSPAVEVLIEQAGRGRGTPENIRAWAQRLADDVGKLAD